MSFMTFVPLTARRVLELWCGDGAFARAYRRRNPTAAYTGFETDPRVAAIARNHIDHVVCTDPERLDAELIGEDSRFDLIIVPNALVREHADLLRRLTRWLRDDGHLLIRPPSDTHWSTYARISSTGPVRLHNDPVDKPPYRFAAETLEMILEANGFEIVRTDPLALSEDDASGAAWLRMARACARQLQRDAEAFMRRVAAAHYVILAGKRAARSEFRNLHVHVAVLAPEIMDIRTHLPARAMRSDPELSVTHGKAPIYLPTLARDAPKILVLQRPHYDELDTWRTNLAKCMKKGWLTVVEFDDHPHAPAAVMNRAPSALDWQRFGLYHAVQTSTVKLRDQFLPYNPEVRVFPNAVFDLPPFPRRTSPPRVFFGTIGRGKFAVEVASSLGRIGRDFPATKFIVVGDRAAFEALPVPDKSYHDILPYKDYLDLMSACEISLSPLADGPVEACKSDAKFLDAARGGVLTIASPTVYADTISDGVNGLIARQLDDWANLLALALADHDRRRAMARRAWEYVRDRRMFASQIPERREWYMDLWARRERLTDQLIARFPGLARELDESTGAHEPRREQPSLVQDVSVE